MPHTFSPQDKKQNTPLFHELWQPVENIFTGMPPLEARGNRPLQINFKHQLKALIFYHLEEHTSGRHLLQVLEENDYARKVITSPNGIKKSSFFEAINSRGLEQLTYVFQQLQAKAAKILHREHAEPGNLVAIDGSLIERFFLCTGQTGVMDRSYQCHKDFDHWQTEGKYFACRIRENTNETCINPIQSNPAASFLMTPWYCLALPESTRQRRNCGSLAIALAIYCHEHYQEKVSIKRVRALRIKIQNEARNLEYDLPNPPCLRTGIYNFKEQKWHSYAIT